MNSSDSLNNQYGSSLPVHANNCYSDIKDPIVSDISDASFGKHFHKLNSLEQVNASTATNHYISTIQSNSTISGSTSVGHDTSATSSRGSPHLQ